MGPSHIVQAQPAAGGETGRGEGKERAKGWPLRSVEDVKGESDYFHPKTQFQAALSGPIQQQCEGSIEKDCCGITWLLLPVSQGVLRKTLQCM